MLFLTRNYLKDVDRWVVALLAQGLLTPRDFLQEENGGFRLQPGAFAKTLYNWEQYQNEKQLEPELDQWVQAFLKFLTSRATD
jgi:hypothetical protein